MSGMPNGMIALPSMLDELFSFRTYEIHSADDNEMFDEYHFWGIVLKKDIGPHKANTWFRAAVILDQFRILELYGEHPFIPVSSYNISLNFTPREPDNE